MIELQDGQHDGWRDTRRLTALAVLLEAAGEPRVASQVMAAAELHHSELVDQLIAGLLAPLDAPAQAAITWLVAIGDADQVAQVAALLDHAFSGARGVGFGGGEDESRRRGTAVLEGCGCLGRLARPHQPPLAGTDLDLSR